MVVRDDSPRIRGVRKGECRPLLDLHAFGRSTFQTAATSASGEPVFRTSTSHPASSALRREKPRLVRRSAACCASVRPRGEHGRYRSRPSPASTCRSRRRRAAGGRRARARFRRWRPLSARGRCRAGSPRSFRGCRRCRRPGGRSAVVCRYRPRPIITRVANAGAAKRGGGYTVDRSRPTRTLLGLAVCATIRSDCAEAGLRGERALPAMWARHGHRVHRCR